MTSASRTPEAAPGRWLATAGHSRCLLRSVLDDQSIERAGRIGDEGPVLSPGGDDLGGDGPTQLDQQGALYVEVLDQQLLGDQLVGDVAASVGDLVPGIGLGDVVEELAASGAPRCHACAV